MEGIERNVQRINGERVHLHQLSVGGLNLQREYAIERAHNAMMDIDKIEAEIATRRDIGEIALMLPEVPYEG